MQPTYRPDIDGLRAVAVLAVVLYHAGFERFAGGFVGVDVFFVISGYLITTVIVQEIRGGTFSLVRFYERRVRRIFPALFAVMAFTLAAGWFLLLPADFKQLGQSVVAAALFLSNVFFYLRSGYFAAPAEQMPLLHTWSLAIEEQYYVFFPLTLVLVARFLRGRYLPVLATLLAVSLGLGIHGAANAPTAAFYLAHTRVWEILLGAILALDTVPRRIGPTLRNGLAGLGLGMIGTSVLAFSAETRFPGIAALLPTLGTFLLVATGRGEGTWASRILGAKPLVGIGLVSYSFYLWHWPLLVFARRFAVDELPAAATAAVLLLALGVSVVSWKVVEQPFRSKSTVRRKRLWAMAVVSVCAALGAGLRIHAGNGLAQRMDVLLQEPLVDAAWGRFTACGSETPEGVFNSPQCHLGAAAPAGSFLLWGDSHARVLASPVHSSSARRGRSGYLAAQVACAPLLGVEWPWRGSCADFNDAVLQAVRRRPHLTTVLLAARWSLYADGTRYKNEDGRTVTLVDTRTDDGNTGNAELFRRGLRRTVHELAAMGRRVVLVGPVPEIGYDVPSKYLTARWIGVDLNAVIAPSRTEYEQRNRDVRKVFNELRSELGDRLAVIDLAQHLCATGTCRVVDGPRVLYRDDDHLSAYGARSIAPLFDPIVDPSPASH